jgi:hypothetical protein
MNRVLFEKLLLKSDISHVLWNTKFFAQKFTTEPILYQINHPYHYIVAYRPVARERPRNKQRDNGRC